MSMDCANFSQSLTPVPPRGHRRLSSSRGTEPRDAETETALPRLPAAELSSSPTHTVLPSGLEIVPELSKTFSWNKAEETSGVLYKPFLPGSPRRAPSLLPVRPEGLSPGPGPDHLHTTPSAPKGLHRSHRSPLPRATGDRRSVTQPSARPIAAIALPTQRGVTGKPLSQESFGHHSSWDHSSWKRSRDSAQRPAPRLAALQAAACAQATEKACLPAAQRVKNPTKLSQQAKSETLCTTRVASTLS